MKNLYRTIAAYTLGLAITTVGARARVVVERDFFPDPVEYNFPGAREPAIQPFREPTTKEILPLSRERPALYEALMEMLRDLERKGSNLTLYWDLLKTERIGREELSDIGEDSPLPPGTIKA